jgi:hypothetical protein
MRHVLAALIAILAGCSRSGAPRESKKARQPEKPEILQFYASPNPVAPGAPAQICWGTREAAKVTLTPHVEEVKPSVARCIEVSPGKTTSYTLTAISNDGLEAFAQTTLTVDARAAAGKQALLQTVTFSALSVKAGEPVSICAETRGASSVTLDPGGVSFPAGTHSCVVSTFTRTTAVTITARGGSGSADRETVTITVR